MSNADDLKILKSENFRKLAAITILDSVIEMFGVDQRVQTGPKAIDTLAKKGLLTNPEKWKNKTY